MYREEPLGSPGGDGGGAGADPQGVGRRREWGRRRGEGEVAQDEEADAPGEGGVVDQLLQRVGHQRGVLLQQLRYNCDQYHLFSFSWIGVRDRRPKVSNTSTSNTLEIALTTVVGSIDECRHPYIYGLIEWIG